MKQLAAIVILLSLLPASARAQVAGTVVDASTLAPIEGARVSVQAGGQTAITDASGAFALPNAKGTAVVVAAKKGWYNRGALVTAPASGLVFALDFVPIVDSDGFQFSTPYACGKCHPQQYGEWLSSPMAHAGRNRWVYDTYDGTGTPGGMGGFVYLRDSALAPSNPASECRSCHQPEPWILDPYSALGPIDDPDGGMQTGVSCQICHQIADIDESRPSFPGIWPGVVTFNKPSSVAPVMYGPLADVDYESPGHMRASYQPQLPSAVCAACHQDKNDPDLDGDFEEDDGVISEPTYVEWLESPYADPSSEKYATCARCHMPATSTPSACFVVPGLKRPFGDVRQHKFRGTTPEYLDNAVALTFAATLAGGTISVDVGVFNDRTGHHVPTGVTIRNVILLVEARREIDGAPLEYTGSERIHELGGVGDPLKGYWAGLPGKLYAKVNHDASGKSPTFFTDASGILFDTRIPALAVDNTHYTFQAPPSGKVHVQARLVYRRSWRALVDAKGWTTDGHGADLEDIRAPDFGHRMAHAEATLDVGEPIGAGGAGGESAAGVGGGGGRYVVTGGCSCEARPRQADEALFLGAILLGLRLRRRRAAGRVSAACSRF